MEPASGDAKRAELRTHTEPFHYQRKLDVMKMLYYDLPPPPPHLLYL
jgi:hypothetical protein